MTSGGPSPRKDETKLLAAIRGSPSPSLLPLFVVSIDSGLRASELRNLRHRDLHLTRAEGVIQSGEIVVSHSKTEGGTGRTVPLTQRSCAVLTLWLRRSKGTQSDSHVFPKHRVGFAGHQRRPCLYNVDPTLLMAEWNSAWEAAAEPQASIIAGMTYVTHSSRASPKIPG